MPIDAGPFPTLDLVRTSPSSVSLNGFSVPENLQAVPYRWLLGPKSTVSFTLDRVTPVEIWSIYRSPFPDEHVTFTLDGRVIDDQTLRGQSTSTLHREVLVAGKHTLSIIPQHYNHFSHAFTPYPNDSREMSLVLSQLQITTYKDLSLLMSPPGPATLPWLTLALLLSAALYRWLYPRTEMLTKT